MEKITQRIRAMPETIISVKAAVKFGIQRKNCQNHGICEITMHDDRNTKPCDTCTQVLLLYKPEKHSLTLRFLKVSMSLLTMQKYFADNIFLMEETYCLSTKNKSALLLDKEKEHYLTEGKYLVKNSRDYLSVTFAMTNSEKQKNLDLECFAFVGDASN